MTTLTDKIRQCQDGVINNPYQGDHKRVLFVCSAGILRSATGARLYAKKYNTRCAGTHLDFALIPLSETLMDWAHEIVFVHPNNYDRANWHFDLIPYQDKIKILSIEDQHEHMSDELIKQFQEQYEPISE